jgi:hypothetical protein
VVVHGRGGTPSPTRCTANTAQSPSRSVNAARASRPSTLTGTLALKPRDSVSDCELLAIRLRPGNAGANTAADHLDGLADAIAQVPAGHRGRLLVRGDSAAGTHAVLNWLTGQNTRRRRVGYSVGWAIGEPERAAVAALPDSAWSPALAADGGVRDGADVAEQADATREIIEVSGPC